MQHAFAELAITQDSIANFMETKCDINKKVIKQNGSQAADGACHVILWAML